VGFGRGRRRFVSLFFVLLAKDVRRGRERESAVSEAVRVCG